MPQPLPKTTGRGDGAHTDWPRGQAHTHHRAEHDGGVAIGFHVLLAQGFYHVGVWLQEEPRELLADQVAAAVPEELACVVVGNQDLRGTEGRHRVTSTISGSQKWREGGAGTSGQGPEAPPLPNSPQWGGSQQCHPWKSEYPPVSASDRTAFTCHGGRSVS